MPVTELLRKTRLLQVCKETKTKKKSDTEGRVKRFDFSHVAAQWLGEQCPPLAHLSIACA